MTAFEEAVIGGLARVEARVEGLESGVQALTTRFETSELARVAASTAHAERFARLESAVGATNGNGNGGDVRWLRRQLERYGPMLLAAMMGGAVSGGALRVSFGDPVAAAASAPAATVTP